MAKDVINMVADGGGSAKIGTAGRCLLTATYNDNMVTFTDENRYFVTVTIADIAQ